MFALCVLVTGLVTYFTQLSTTKKYVVQQTEARAQRAAKEVTCAIEEFPSNRWLINYWYEHDDELDIEYDVRFTNSTITEKKTQLLKQHQPDLDPHYVSVESVRRLPEEDQKLFAEIVYSWLLTRMNEIKTIHKIDYLFIVLSKDPYTDQYFLMSAADPGSVRGTEYEQVYPLGVQTEVGESQSHGMKSAVQHSSHIADAGKYVDYYSYYSDVYGHDVLIGMTYNLSEILLTVGSETKKSSMMAMGYQIVYSALFSLGILFLVLKPLKTVQESIRRYKENKDSAAVATDLSKINLNNEIGQLAVDVTDLTKEIDDYLNEIQSITSEKERMKTELSLAAQIQNSMLPSIFPPFPERAEFDLFATMNPAREVGGDFYDFFLIDDDHLGLVIADVSGKGIPAALFMMVSKIILKTHALMGITPSEVLMKANEAICGNNQAEMFVTVWIGVLEISSGKLTAANAGHEYPAIKHADGYFELLKDKHGLVIGAIEDAVYKDYEVMLEKGSKLFVYTDGVPEATDKENNMFGTERMLDALNKEIDAGPEKTLANVRDDVNEFVQDAEQFDDMTMLCLELI